MSIESVMASNHLILCCPLLLLSSIFASIRVFSGQSVLHIRWPKYWSFSFSISPSNECSGLISFRIDWLALLAVQGSFKSLLQHHSSKASTLWCSAFFILQLSHSYITSGKTIPLTRWIFVGKVMSLLCNMLSRFVITFLPRSKHLLVSWLKSPSAVILEPRKIVCHCFHCFPIYLPWSDGTRCHDLNFTLEPIYLWMSFLEHCLPVCVMCPYSFVSYLYLKAGCNLLSWFCSNCYLKSSLACTLEMLEKL